jgi:hypothetical protein
MQGWAIFLVRGPDGFKENVATGQLIQTIRAKAQRLQL